MRGNNAFMPVSQLELGHRAVHRKLRVQCERYGYLMSRIWSCWDGQCLFVFGIWCTWTVAALLMAGTISSMREGSFNTFCCRCLNLVQICFPVGRPHLYKERGTLAWCRGGPLFFSWFQLCWHWLEQSALLDCVENTVIEQVPTNRSFHSITGWCTATEYVEVSDHIVVTALSFGRCDC
jgi:hypothetical protein